MLTGAASENKWIAACSSARWLMWHTQAHSLMDHMRVAALAAKRGSQRRESVCCRVFTMVVMDSLRTLAKLIGQIRGDADALTELILDVDEVHPDTRLLNGLIRAAAADGHNIATLHVLTGISREKLQQIVAGSPV